MPLCKIEVRCRIFTNLAQVSLKRSEHLHRAENYPLRNVIIYTNAIGLLGDNSTFVLLYSYTFFSLINYSILHVAGNLLGDWVPRAHSAILTFNVHP